MENPTPRVRGPLLGAVLAAALLTAGGGLAVSNARAQEGRKPASGSPLDDSSSLQSSLESSQRSYQSSLESSQRSYQSSLQSSLRAQEESSSRSQEEEQRRQRRDQQDRQDGSGQGE